MMTNFFGLKSILYISVYIYTHIYISVCVCLHVCMFVCLCVRVRVCEYIGIDNLYHFQISVARFHFSVIVHKFLVIRFRFQVEQFNDIFQVFQDVHFRQFSATFVQLLLFNFRHKLVDMYHNESLSDIFHVLVLRYKSLIICLCNCLQVSGIKTDASQEKIDKSWWVLNLMGLWCN